MSTKADKNKYLLACGSIACILLIITVGLFFFTSCDTKDETATTTDKAGNTISTQLKGESTDNTSKEELSETIPENTDVTIQEGSQETTKEGETVEKKKGYINTDLPYLVKVNRVANCVTVYTKDEKGKFTVPYKAFACSCGRELDFTPTGTFNTSDKIVMCSMVDGTYGQYAYRIDYDIMFHSVPCLSNTPDTLEADQYNKLGNPASLGCVRLCVRDAKWLFDNCPFGTTVIIYDDADDPGPLGKPASIHIPEDHKYSGWDPTDPSENNPWNKLMPTISGASDKVVKRGSAFDPLDGITAKDTCFNDVTSSLKVEGTVDTTHNGSYELTYSITDLLGRTTTKKVTITVNNSGVINETTQKVTTEKATTTKKETTSKETTKKETTSKEPTKKETTSKETTKKETTKKETTSKEPPSEEETEPPVVDPETELS